MKELYIEISTLIKESQLKFEISKRIVLLRRVGLVVGRAEHLETKLDSFIEKWNTSDCNTTNLEELTDEFKLKIEEARTTYNDSRALWEQFTESIQNHEPDTQTLREAQGQMQLAQLKLKEAHLILKEIIVELRICRGIEPEEEPEEECTTNEDCEEGEFCEEGECKPEEEIECEITADCPNNMTCTEGLCVEIECTVNEDCEEDEVCTEGFCVEIEE